MERGSDQGENGVGAEVFGATDDDLFAKTR